MGAPRIFEPPPPLKNLTPQWENYSFSATDQLRHLKNALCRTSFLSVCPNMYPLT